MIIKYKDKEYNIELNVKSLIELKDKCYNNEFYYLFKYLITIDEFSKWFYSEYSDYKEFMQYPNRCVICNKHSRIEFCKEHQNTKEFFEWRLTKTKQTNLEKYGVENVYQSKEIKNKIKRIKLKKYGDENYNNRDKFNITNNNKSEKEKLERIEKIKRSHNSKSKKEVERMIKKSKETKLEKYGDETYNNREKCKQTCLKKYGVENVYQSKEIKNKIKETCLQKYLKTNFSQFNFKNIENLNALYVKENFIKNNRFLMEDFKNYFNFKYKCAMSYKSKFNIQEHNKTNLFKTQQYIFDNIKTENKIFNDRTILDGKELDIYLPDFNLAIEYNGLMFHSQGYSTSSIFNTLDFDKNYHLDKTNQCLNKGIQLFHIFEGENLDLWLSMINNKLGLNKRIFARKCYVAELKSKDIFNFLNDNHIQGYVQSSINLGLFYTDGVELPKLVSVMTFSKPRFNKHYEYELIRFCSLKNTSVIGGANKLLKYFINKYNPKSIISYANRRFSNGSIYETLGFKKIGTSGPNYFYFKDSTELESRNKYQKHKLKSLLPDFDENLSEAENMFKNGYRRIYDCGNLVYELIL